MLGFQAPNRERGLEGMGPLALHQVVIHSTQVSPRWWELSSAHSPHCTPTVPQTLHNASAGNFPSRIVSHFLLFLGLSAKGICEQQASSWA